MTEYLLTKIFAMIAEGNKITLKVLFASGRAYQNFSGEETPRVQVRFKTVRAQWYTLFFMPTGLLDCYIDGSVDLEGEAPVHDLAELGHAAGLENDRSAIFSQSPLVFLKHAWTEWVQNNVVRAQAIKNADFHYALPVELFKYKLGDTVGYSEGYWVEGTQNINQAKHNLYEYICQKLQLKPGMRVLEVGSGWGFLPIYMVKNYDVDVVVYNPTEAQNEYMQKRFERHGVSDRIKIVFGVHEDIANEPKESFDRFVSIGVHEHHGMSKKLYRAWWESIAHVLKDGGVGVISTSSFMEYGMTGYLTLNYIWPGGHIPSVPLEISELHRAGFTLIEWENLWTHYYKTLCMWRDRFKEFWPQIRASNPEVFTERFRRRWTMYLEAVPEVFERSLDNSHFLFIKGRNMDAYPKTLEGRYKTAQFKTGDDPVECYE